MEQNLYFLYFITVLQDYVKFIKQNEAQFQSYFVQFKSFFSGQFLAKTYKFKICFHIDPKMFKMVAYSP